MKIKKVIWIPILMVFISIITSIIAFQQSEKLELGQIYVGNSSKKIFYEGEYFSIIGNIDFDSYYLSIDSTSNGIIITTHSIEEEVQKTYNLIVKKQDGLYDESIVVSILSNEVIFIDDMEDYLFRLYLEADQYYDFSFERTDENPDDNQLDIALINLPENILNMKGIMESISFTTVVFAIISGLSIIGLYFIKKRD